MMNDDDTLIRCRTSDPRRTLQDLWKARVARRQAAKDEIRRLEILALKRQEQMEKEQEKNADRYGLTFEIPEWVFAGKNTANEE